MELSVHLMTYNNEDFIEQTIISILKQKCDFDFEIVVNDDCSTDKTLDIIYKYSNQNLEMFSVVKNPKQLGILKNFKATLDRCNGKYVFDIAGDDIFITENALQKLVDAFRVNPHLGFVDSGYDKLLVNSKKRLRFFNKKHITISKENYKEYIFLGKVIPVGICYNKKAIYNYVNFDDYIKKNITIEDYPILVNLAKNCDFERINNVLHEYRLHKKSYSQKESINHAYFLRQQMQKLFLHFKEKYEFSESLEFKFKENHHKALLFSAGVYEDKVIGKESYKAIKNKSVKDVIHYLASQYPLVRSIIKLRRAFT